MRWVRAMVSGDGDVLVGAKVTPFVPRLAARTSLRQQVARQLRAALVGGEMVPGVTYSSAALAERFGTSATPVREAMLDLIKEGMVVALPNKGFRVVLPDQRELAEMKEMLLLLEVPTAGRIAGSVGRDQVARLRAQANRVAAAARAANVADYIEGDREFHHDLLALAGNAQLVKAVDQLRTRTWLYARQRLLGGDGGLVQSAAEHLALVKAIAAGDRGEARRLMAQHLGHAHTAAQDM